MSNQRKMVQCIAIDNLYLYTLCNQKLCPCVIHKYGSGNDFKNRFENRSSHCSQDNSEIIIRIDDTTIRTSIKIFKNKRKIEFLDKKIWE